MSDVEIVPWLNVVREGTSQAPEAELDRIFFASRARRSFETDMDRAAFRERWLGRYLEHFSPHALVAIDQQRRIVGYVIGSLDDPAHDPLFADLAFMGSFKALTAAYPAQLHINVAPEWRGRGVGGQLIEAFCARAHDLGAPGAHVVTTRGMRNVDFYVRHQFLERGAAVVNERELILLGRVLLGRAL